MSVPTTNVYFVFQPRQVNIDEKTQPSHNKRLSRRRCKQKKRCTFECCRQSPKTDVEINATQSIQEALVSGIPPHREMSKSRWGNRVKEGMSLPYVDNQLLPSINTFLPSRSAQPGDLYSLTDTAVNEQIDMNTALPGTAQPTQNAFHNQYENFLQTRRLPDVDKIEELVFSSASSEIDLDELSNQEANFGTVPKQARDSNTLPMQMLYIPDGRQWQSAEDILSICQEAGISVQDYRENEVINYPIPDGSAINVDGNQNAVAKCVNYIMGTNEEEELRKVGEKLELEHAQYNIQKQWNSHGMGTDEAASNDYGLKGDNDGVQEAFCRDTDIVQAAALSSGVVEESYLPETQTEETHTEYIVEITDESDAVNQGLGPVASEVQIDCSGKEFVPIADSDNYIVVNKEMVDKMEPNCYYILNSSDTVTALSEVIQFESGEADLNINNVLQNVSEVAQTTESTNNLAENAESNNLLAHDIHQNQGASNENKLVSDTDEVATEKGYSLSFWDQIGNVEQKKILNSDSANICTNDNGRGELQPNEKGQSLTQADRNTPKNEINPHRYILHDEHI